MQQWPESNEAEAIKQFAKQYLSKLTLNDFIKDASCLYDVTPDHQFVIDNHPDYPQIVFAAAAKKLFISSSVISKRISRLENQLRVQLIQRTTRTMTLTESGQLFYEHCKRIKSEINDAADIIQQQHQIPSGLLRINAPMSFGQVHLIPAVNDFLALYPEDLTRHNCLIYQSEPGNSLGIGQKHEWCFYDEKKN